MTFQVSDVQVTSKTVRRLVVAHGVVSFFYNVAVLALMVNIGGEFIKWTTSTSRQRRASQSEIAASTSTATNAATRTMTRNPDQRHAEQHDQHDRRDQGEDRQRRE